ncbi:TetR/AcrR family transcriptional regulator [Beutenbergia cavernae]|uniref:TetR/AcrR family transcriptional regulator n=1 Tax=Beutenbergia cavernae TaxID=84757 RepID=UPI00019AD38D|nr:TetR family transcriptional regulator [Beutenbergia cavernae]
MEGTGRRERKKQQTRDAVVAAATDLFATRGFRQTTVADIAAAADIAPRTFFLHFASKEDVLFAHVEDFVAEAANAIRAAPQGADPVDAVVGAVELLVAHFPEIAALAVDRSRVLGAVAGVPVSLLRRLVRAHAALVAAAEDRFGDAVDAVELGALVGAVLGAASSAARARPGADAGAAQAAMRTAVRRAAQGFRD